MKKKILAAVLACALCVGIGVGGTLAWLTATAPAVTNTFTVGDIDISLTETTGTSYKFVPGDTIAKDPTVTVEADSEACYLFIHVTDANNTITDAANHNKIIDWAVASGWTAVDGHDGYWYRMVSASTSDQSFAVLTDGISTDNKVGSVKVSTEVTKEMVDTINTVATQPTITVTAAAIQQDNVTDLADAWSKLPETFTGVTSGT